MSYAKIDESLLTGIANAIRGKNGSSDTYTPAQMATAISAIPTGEVLWANWNGDVAAYNSSGTPQITDLSITVPVAGTYKVKSIVRNTYPYSYGSGAHVRYYKNNTAVGTQHTVAAATFSAVEETITCAAGDVITLYCCSANSTYTTACSGLFVCPA